MDVHRETESGLFCPVSVLAQTGAEKTCDLCPTDVCILALVGLKQTGGVLSGSTVHD